MKTQFPEKAGLYWAADKHSLEMNLIANVVGTAPFMSVQVIKTDAYSNWTTYDNPAEMLVFGPEIKQPKIQIKGQ